MLFGLGWVRLVKCERSLYADVSVSMSVTASSENAYYVFSVKRAGFLAITQSVRREQQQRAKGIAKSGRICVQDGAQSCCDVTIGQGKNSCVVL